ncbi:hypothetical protein QBC36DRAFT_237707 [Triangularia setosa]|uniref:Tetratricopeptide repeat protein 15 n=1 Tax=Triangularia setosa TaxID=2587417 RepID=A0AAN6WBA9_9PEZI|nr:hypothetical protein QBC36DRAFT_237707 [Podospora setosa]
MDQAQQNNGKGHKRTRSAVKATRPRSSTKGPLDVDDPLAPQPTSPPSTITPAANPPSPNPQLIPQLTSRMRSPLPRSPAPSPGPGTPRRAAAAPPGSTATTPRPKDFSFLLRPEIYHPLTPLNIPSAFRNSSKQPPPETPLSKLLEKGHFRAAAISAVQTLTGTGPTPQPDPSDYTEIFELLYTRLACLTLINSTDLAAQEVKALGDLNSAFYLAEDQTRGKTNHLVPWELRVLNVRLQAIGFGDLRRAVMSYYELAREARMKLAEAMEEHDNSSRELWRERLEDLGVRVAGALVEMGDVKGAGEHLKGLKAGEEGGKMEMMRALLWLRLGDVDAARGCVMSGEGRGVTRGERVVLALCDMADGEYEEAVGKWRELREEGGEDEMVVVNLAVCLLYVGRLQEGRALLEGMVDAGRSSHTLLFNLTIMYELCTERARSLKVRLSEKVAGMEETNHGWEKTNADFKL